MGCEIGTGDLTLAYSTRMDCEYVSMLAQAGFSAPIESFYPTHCYVRLTFQFHLRQAEILEL